MILAPQGTMHGEWPVKNDSRNEMSSTKQSSRRSELRDDEYLS